MTPLQLQLHSAKSSVQPKQVFGLVLKLVLSKYSTQLKFDVQVLLFKCGFLGLEKTVLRENRIIGGVF